MSSISIADYKRLYTPKKRTKRHVSVKKERVISEGEAKLVQQLKAYKIEFEQEFRFDPNRKWRADFHLVGKLILIEVEGGIWLQGGGRHTRGKGYIADMEKYNSAQKLGYAVYRYSTEQVKSGLAIEEIRRLVG